MTPAVKRLSPTVILATVASGCVLAAGGYLVGKRSGDAGVPARVPLHALQQHVAADPIPVPSGVDLPQR
jgi:hypothetical protein